jgi:light-regulated signal transduction histidine kinase (bacteriophytochrome)
MKKIEQQRLNLESMNRDKEKIFSIIAHDIKSPFANLEALVFMFRNQMLDSKASQEYIQQIHQQITQQQYARYEYQSITPINQTYDTTNY